MINLFNSKKSETVKAIEENTATMKKHSELLTRVLPQVGQPVEVVSYFVSYNCEDLDHPNGGTTRLWFDNAPITIPGGIKNYADIRGIEQYIAENLIEDANDPVVKVIGYQEMSRDGGIKQ